MQVKSQNLEMQFLNLDLIYGMNLHFWIFFFNHKQEIHILKDETDTNKLVWQKSILEIMWKQKSKSIHVTPGYAS